MVKSNRSYLFMLLLFMGITASLAGLVYYLWNEQKVLRRSVVQLQADRIDLNKHIAIGSQQVIEKTIIKKEVWRSIQEQVKDTVVQVFSQISEINLLQPYKTQEHSVYGTAFLINEEGDIITNAHVVNQAQSVWIQIPSLGKRIIDVDVVGVSPERDLALLRVRPEGLELIKAVLGHVPHLNLGDSNSVRRSDEVLALGYPLGQRALKSTTGVISGREGHLIQMSAPINPGNSGGPLLNADGEVVGINTANVPDAQNVGYIIPINDLKNVLSDLYSVKLLRKPYLGILYSDSSSTLTEFLGNPEPGGCYIVEVVKDSTLYKSGVQRGDMLYEINGYSIDMFGDMDMPWSEDKISITDYVSSFSIGQDVNIVIYRKGKRKEFTVTFGETEPPAIRRVYLGYEDLDYEVFGGMVVTPLTLNHIKGMINGAPGLAKYADIRSQTEPVLIITHIFPNSQLHRSRTVLVGATLNEVNGMKVTTLEEFRNAIKSSVGSKYLTLRVSDNVMRFSDYVFAVLPFDQVLKEESELSRYYRYPLSDMAKELLQTMLPMSVVSPLA